jgi:hypothetical protein
MFQEREDTISWTRRFIVLYIDPEFKKIYPFGIHCQFSLVEEIWKFSYHKETWI